MNLEEKLHELKLELQDKALLNGESRKPIICDDEVISLLAYYKPKSIDELSNISGVGDTFIQKYGSDFVRVINEELDKCSNVELTPVELEIFSKLENRLVNINKRNPLLYSGKLNSNRYIDLYNLDSDNTLYKELVMDQSNKKIKLCKPEDKFYKNIVKLQREVNRIQTETGSNELYIGYPFVQGLMGIDNFTIKAPLVLFPCVLDKENGCFTIQFDASRDILYNNTLILANNKFRGKNIVLPDNIVEELNKENFVSEIMSFYNNNGMYISKYNDGFTKFLENTTQEFPKYSSDELEIYEYMVLGIFQSFSTSMQRDYETIKSRGKVNSTIKDLIWGLDDSKKDTTSSEYLDNSSFSEGDITYINDLNYSQEKVLAMFDSSSSLVVEGPPGTGKSQMITSLIAQLIKQNKKVLMVSEKKQALDVINSRLGELSNYSIIIDAINNKEEFYNQIKKILSNDLVGSHYSLTEIDFLVKKVDANINKLKTLQSVMFDDNSFGINIQSIYAKCKNYDFNNPEVLKFYNYLKKHVDSRILSMNYETLRNLKRKFSDKSNNKNLCGYLEIKKKYDFQKYIKLDITDFEYNNLVNYLRTYSSICEEINNSNVFKKIMLKNKYRKEFVSTFKNVCVNGDSLSLYKAVNENINNLIDFFNNYEEFKLNKLKYLELNENEVIWFDNLCEILNEKETCLDEVNIELYNYLLYLQIEKFERDNYMTLNSVNSFFDITREINNCVSQRSKLEKIIVKNKLLESLKKLDKNNGRKEIERRSNQTRKLAINKFISKHKFELFDSINIWMMTPDVVSEILPMQEELFDVVIFDEASQLFIERAIPSVYRAKKIMVAGDSKQLKPSCLGVGRTSDDEDEQEAIMESESLLDLALYKFPKTLLNYHYRSKYEELIAFSNYGFYGANLYVSPNIEKPLTPPIERIKIENGQFINRENKNEAIEVVKLLKKVVNEKNDSKTIGIITFNVAQRDLLLDLIEEEKAHDEEFAVKIEKEFSRKEQDENQSLFVKNIENVQGDERDIIIFSTLYAKGEDGRVSTNFGWLNDLAGENRLNVAISRAKEKIYIVTSIEPEELNVESSKNRGPKLFKKYLEYSRAVSNSNYELVQEILNSLLETSKEKVVLEDTNEIIDNLSIELENIGIKSIKNLGVGGYVIDLVLLDEDNNYILAIEPDGKLYEYSKVVRERDFHRKKYLESRGWNVYRLWSYNWFKNKNKEINKIVDIYNKLK